MGQRKLSVLFWDHQARLNEHIRRYLSEHHGYTVDFVRTPQKATEALSRRDRQYDVALIDDLPDSDFDSLDVLRRIKRQYPETPVIFLTGRGLNTALQALREGAERYVTKPFDPETLALTIQLVASSNTVSGRSDRGADRTVGTGSR